MERGDTPTPSMRSIQSDFDRIALLPASGWEHNSHYHGYLLQSIPAHCAQALEIGCGTGAFARLLAQRSDHVLALDLSPQMVRIARQQSSSLSNIDWRIADALTYEFPDSYFDCVVSIATLHHLPLEQILLKISKALKAGGVLIVLDLFQSEGISDLLTSALALPTDVVLRLIKRGHLRESREVRAAWAEHGRSDVFMTLAQIRKICLNVLPNACIRRHLLWRYSIVWTKSYNS
jgi:ubiquinone/menaquinone biosynthesis C-methylase UbiE